MMELDRREISRYLGYRGAPLSPEVAAYADACASELERTVVPRIIGRRLSLAHLIGESRDLAHHLRHCRPLIPRSSPNTCPCCRS